VQKNTLLIDSSTIDPAVSREIAALATNQNSDYLDAPVSGGKDRSPCQLENINNTPKTSRAPSKEKFLNDK